MPPIVQYFRYFRINTRREKNKEHTPGTAQILPMGGGGSTQTRWLQIVFQHFFMCGKSVGAVGSETVLLIGTLHIATRSGEADPAPMPVLHLRSYSWLHCDLGVSQMYTLKGVCYRIPSDIWRVLLRHLLASSWALLLPRHSSSFEHASVTVL